MAQRFERARLLKSIRAFNAAVNQYTGGWQPQLALELALIEVLQSEPMAVAAAPAPPPGERASPPKPRRDAERAASAASTAPTADTDYQRAEASAPGEPPVYSASKIHEGWTEVLSRAFRYNKNIPPLLDNAHVRAIEGNRLILGVTNEVFVSMIEAPKRAQVIEQAIHDLHGVKLVIDVRVVDAVVTPSDGAHAKPAEAEDPLVAAGRALGGTIDD